MRVSDAERHIVALDLDGTVLNHGTGFASDPGEEGRIDPALADAIRTLHDSGHEVVVATGRSVDATLPIVELLRIRPDWVVCCNGAVTLRRDPLAHRGFRREYVESFDPSTVLKQIRTHLLGARFALERVDGTFLYTDDIPSGTLPSRQKRVTFDELLDTEATRVVVVSPDHRLEDFLEVVDLIGLTSVSYAVGRTAWLDIAPDGVSKASALEVVAARIGIPRSRVFAAGDGRNDIEMLNWAGRYGDSVAMGQAVAEVQRSAKRVTGTIDEVGLLSALRERFPALIVD